MDSGSIGKEQSSLRRGNIAAVPSYSATERKASTSAISSNRHFASCETIVPRTQASWAGEVDLEEADNGAIRDGTVISSAMNLAACAFGASMLSLPYALMIGGPVPTFAMLILFAVVAFFAGQAVVHAGLRWKRSTYELIVGESLGTTVGIVAEAFLSIALLVAAISYIVGLAELLPKIFPLAGVVPQSARSTSFLLREVARNCFPPF